MSFYIRFMRREDLPQVVEIDREAFPTQWPPTNYRNELDNRLAHYVVAIDKDAVQPETQGNNTGDKGLVTRVKQLFNRNNNHNAPTTPPEYVTGFAGCWIMADEAHVTEIAVRGTYRGTGLGELLLVSIYDLAKEYKANYMTLEVRLTNTPAQNLYRKYGFNRVGARRGYYTDNKEDALIMTTNNINTPEYEAKMEGFKTAIARRLNLDRIYLLR